MKVKAILVLTSMSLLAGCAGHYEYPLYQARSQAYGRTLPLRVAIPYPDEGLSAPDRDADLETFIAANCRQAPTYISPRLEISRGLLDELRATRAFEALHWSPDSLEDYDLVVRLKILSGGRRFESESCPALLGPFRWELALYDQRGAELLRREFTLAAIKIYSASPAAEFRKDEAVFLGEMTSVILGAAEELARKVPDTGDARSLAYMEKKAPELKELREGAAEDRRLGRDYLMRVSLLEAGRLAEARSAEALQPVYDQAWQEVQLAVRGELKKIGEDANHILVESLTSLGGAARVAGVKPPKVLTAIAGARAEAARSVAGPDGARKLVDGISKKLLPGDLRKLAAEAGVNEELAAKLRSALQGGAAADGERQAGCGKDTDCKGDRICVRGECVSP